MMVFSYLKIGAGLVVLAICSYYVLNYEHMRTKIAAQQLQIANLEVKQEALDKKQASFDAFMAKRPVIQKRVQNEKAHIDQTVATVDDAGLRALYDHYKLLPEPKVSLTTDGGVSRLKYTPRGAAGPP